MADLIREAKERLNRTPFAHTSLYEARLDHLQFLQRLAKGAL